jgi:hypothetical protein
MNGDHPDEDIDLTSTWKSRLQTAGLVLGIATWVFGAILSADLLFDDPRGMGAMYNGLALMLVALPLTAIGAVVTLSLTHFAHDFEARVGKTLALSPVVLLPVASLLEASLSATHPFPLADPGVAVAYLAAALHIPGMILVVARLLLGSKN